MQKETPSIQKLLHTQQHCINMSNAAADMDPNDRPNKRLRIDEPTANATELTQDDQEEAVGITVYVSPEMPGFRCTVKQRYTDFLVNEILPSGKVLHLTQLPETKRRQHDEIQAAVPKDSHATPVAAEAPPITEPAQPEQTGEVFKPKSNGHAPAQQQDENASPQVELSREDKHTLDDIFGEATTPKIRALYSAVLKNPHRKARDHPTIMSEVITEKSKRTEAHMAVRRIFDSKLQTETMQDQPGVIAIKAAPSKAAAGVRSEQSGGKTNGATKGKLGWNDLGGEYLHFTLYKENKDTMEVLYFIASQLKVPVKNFQFAGTKDRRGVTVQRVAVYRVHANRVAGLNRLAKGWVASDFEYKKHGLELGELTGNEFLLTLRDCHFDSEDGLDNGKRLELAKDVVTKTAQSFKTKGFLNYYGLQRFGTFTTGTHVIGLKMLQGDLEGAIDSILSYSPDALPENQDSDGMSRIPQDDISRADAIRKWREDGLAGPELLARMPKRFQAETAIMQYLDKKDKKTGKLFQERDWQGALMMIQRNLRLMYVHAYQSLVWNTVAGKRWKMFGDRVAEGDLVIVGEKGGDPGAGKKDEVDEDGEPIFRPAADDSAPSAEDTFTRARQLSKEEAESGKFDIFDIVLPQPGFDVLYPKNAIGTFYKEFMGSEVGGGLDPHSMRRTWKDVSLSGAYRKMMAKPLSGVVECEVRGYEGVEEQMVETDLEGLRRVQAGDGGLEAEQGGDAEEKNRIAVVMKFQLGSSQYATMALRELTKGGAAAYKPDFSTAR